MKKFLSIILFLLSTVAFAQESSKTKLQKATQDSVKCRLLDHLFNEAINYDEKLTHNKQLEQLVEKNLKRSNIPTAERKLYLLYKILYLNNYGFYHLNQKNTNNELALKYYQQSLKIATQIKNNQKKANAYSNLGIVYGHLYKYPEALQNHFESLHINKLIDDKKSIGQDYHNLGSIYEDLGNYPEALKNYFSSLKIKEVLKDTLGIMLTYNNLAVLYIHQAKLDKGLKYQLKALTIAKKIENESAVGDAYTNIGITYIDQGKFAEAIKNLLDALKIFEKLGDQNGVGTAYGNIGAAYMYQGNYQKALENYFTALKVREQNGDIKGTAYSYLGIGMTEMKLKDAKSAKKHFEKTLAIAKTTNNKTLIKYSYKNLAKADSALGIFKGAYINYKLYIQKRDSLENAESKRKSIETALQYEFEKKEAVAKEKSDAEKKQAQFIYNTVIAFLIFVLVFFVTWIYFYRIKQKNAKLLRERELSLQIAETERRRISADLHDDLGIGISTISLLGNRIKSRKKLEATKLDANDIIENTQKISEKLTEIIWELNAEHNNLEHLLLFIQKQGKNIFKDTETSFSMVIPLEIPHTSVAGNERKQIYLAVKECFNNIRKHAKASKASCNIAFNGWIIFNIKDNGIGFDVSKTLNSANGEGLKNLKYRLDNLNGKVNIASTAKGTTITIEVPLKK